MPSISDASAVISHSPKPRPAHSRPVGDDDGDYGEDDEDYDDGDDAAAAAVADGDEEGAADEEEEDVDVVVEAAKVVRLSATMSASPRAAQGWTEEEFVKYMDWFRQVDTRKAGFITLQDMQVRVAQEGWARTWCTMWQRSCVDGGGDCGCPWVVDVHQAYQERVANTHFTTEELQELIDDKDDNGNGVYSGVCHRRPTTTTVGSSVEPVTDHCPRLRRRGVHPRVCCGLWLAVPLRALGLQVGVPLLCDTQRQWEWPAHDAGGPACLLESVRADNHGNRGRHWLGWHVIPRVCRVHD